MCLQPVGYGILLPTISWGLYTNAPTRNRVKIISEKQYWDYLRRNDIDKKRLTILKCGQCLECKAQNASSWAVRCVNEASLHRQNCFLTLTYNEENLPKNYRKEGILKKSDLVNFKKRLRKKIKVKIKTFECGEYGEKGRPHFHILIFGWSPKDLEFFKKGKNGDPIFKSKTVQKIWGKGFITVGMISHKSAAYVARYTSKKLLPDNKKDLPAPFINMSRREGIGKKWIEKNLYKILDDKNIIVDGKSYKIPKYYKKILWDTVTQNNHFLTQTNFILSEYRKDRNAINKPYLEFKKYCEKNKEILKISDEEFKKLEKQRKEALDKMKKTFYNRYAKLLKRNCEIFRFTILDYLHEHDNTEKIKYFDKILEKGGKKYIDRLNSLKVERLKKLKRGLE